MGSDACLARVYSLPDPAPLRRAPVRRCFLARTVEEGGDGAVHLWSHDPSGRLPSHMAQIPTTAVPEDVARLLHEYADAILDAQRAATRPGGD